MRWLVVVLASLVFAPAAYGQGLTIQAVDTGATWSPPSSRDNPLTVKAGDSSVQPALSDLTLCGTVGPVNVFHVTVSPALIRTGVWVLSEMTLCSPVVPSKVQVTVEPAVVV